MAKYLPLPKSLQEVDKTFVRDVITATEERFKKELFREANNPPSKPYTTADGKYHWKTSDEILTYVTDLTNTSDIISANTALYQTLSQAPEYSEPTMTGAPEYPVSATTPSQSLREQQEIEREKRETSEKEIANETKNSVETALARQKELFEKEAQKAKKTEADLKGKTIYVKAEEKAVEKTKEVESLRQQAKANPKEVAEIIERNIKERLPNAPDTAAKQATYDIIVNLQTDGQSIINEEVVSGLSQNPKKITDIVSDLETSKDLIDWTHVLADKNSTSLELSRAITQAAFGEVFQKEVLPDFVISFSDTPQEDFREFGLDQIPQKYSAIMQENSSFFDGLKGFSVDEVRTQINLKINSILTRQIEKLPADSTLKIAFKSDLVQGLLPGVRMATPAAWEAVEGSFFGKMAVSSGFAPALGWIGKKTGIDFGIKKVAQVAIQGGVEGATGVGVAAGITAAFAWTGPLAPAIGAIGAFLVETIGAKVVGNAVNALKDNAQKYGKWIVAAVGAGFGLLLGGGSIITGLVGGVLGYGAATVIAGGLPALSATAGAVVAGAGSFFGALASASLGAIAAPIIGFLIGFPLIVIFILFIINSGAYVVPPAPPQAGFLGSGIPIECSNEKGPVGVAGPSSSSPIANRAWQITYDLYQGFWCYWNRSPVAPAKYFPGDILKYPPSYPETFGYEQFIKDPNPRNENGLNMFWCTYLVIKSYSENGNAMKFSENDGSAQNMFDHFKSLGRSISTSGANSKNIVPGSAIFFHVSSGHSGINHVGIVYTVDDGGIVFVQSNGPLKSQSVNFKPSGGVGNITDGGVIIEVAGFGLP
ncbi:MAG TPA: hypothetical protein VKC54_00045 [Patescibacteria group bacterium]|nr:hypothetical protein [Patescibacteria group bacterium]